MTEGLEHSKMNVHINAYLEPIQGWVCLKMRCTKALVPYMGLDYTSMFVGLGMEITICGSPYIQHTYTWCIQMQK